MCLIYVVGCNRSLTGRKRRKSKTGRTKRKAIRDTVLRWKDGIIPFKYVTNHFSKSFKHHTITIKLVLLNIDIYIYIKYEIK